MRGVVITHSDGCDWSVSLCYCVAVSARAVGVAEAPNINNQESE